MGHGAHRGMPGYSPAQLLHDHCPECGARGKQLRDYLPHCDATTWQAAWRRAVQWGRDGLDDVSDTERTILRELWQIAVAFQTQAPPEALLDFAYQGLWLTGDAVVEAGMGQR